MQNSFLVLRTLFAYMGTLFWYLDCYTIPASRYLYSLITLYMLSPMILCRTLFAYIELFFGVLALRTLFAYMGTLFWWPAGYLAQPWETPETLIAIGLAVDIYLLRSKKSLGSGNISLILSCSSATLPTFLLHTLLLLHFSTSPPTLFLIPRILSLHTYQPLLTFIPLPFYCQPRYYRQPPSSYVSPSITPSLSLYLLYTLIYYHLLSLPRSFNVYISYLQSLGLFFFYFFFFFFSLC